MAMGIQRSERSLIVVMSVRFLAIGATNKVRIEEVFPRSELLGFICYHYLYYRDDRTISILVI